MSNRQKVTEELQPAEFIEVKGWKAIGNKLVDKKILSIREASSGDEEKEEAEEPEEPQKPSGKSGVQGNLFNAPVKAAKKEPARPVKKPAPPKAKKGPPTRKGSSGASKGGYLLAGDTIEFDV